MFVLPCCSQLQLVVAYFCFYHYQYSICPPQLELHNNLKRFLKWGNNIVNWSGNTIFFLLCLNAAHQVKSYSSDPHCYSNITYVMDAICDQLCKTDR